MQSRYTSLRCANRGPHKVNSHSYVGSYNPPRIVPTPTPSPATAVEIHLPWYIRFWNWIKSLFI